MRPVDLASLAVRRRAGCAAGQGAGGARQARGRQAASGRWGISGCTVGLSAEVDRDAALLTAPAAPAAEVYTGVLFQHLDLATLSAAALARAREQVLVASALWGVVALEDRIPAYRLSIGARLPALTRSGLAAWWRPALAKALPDEPGQLVVDLRSGGYAAAWRPQHATLVEVKASTAEGKPISHMAKAVRGTVARRLLQARSRRDRARRRGARRRRRRRRPRRAARAHAPARPGSSTSSPRLTSASRDD